jgi:hypothetical protein
MLDPPRPALTYASLVDGGFYADFDRLRMGVRRNVSTEPWMWNDVRTAILYWLKMERAQEELVRIHVEGQRVLDWIRTQTDVRGLALAMALQEESPYYGELIDHGRVHMSMEQVIFLDLGRIPGMALPQVDEDISDDSESEDELERRDAAELAGAMDNLVNI